MKVFVRSLFSLALAGILATPVTAQSPDQIQSALSSMEWRAIGPANMGGRVSAIQGVPGNPRIFWVGGADGGVFKTINGGTTFEEQFTDQPVYSVGALALAPSDYNVLWLGSGEGDPRNSTSYGNGVYRSTDGGEHWAYLGLGDTERIKRIVVDPRDPDVALVCALGHAWGPNTERGVFRTKDGGQSWEKVLYIDEDTGCSDMDMDRSNPRILYAGMWTHRRRPWRFDDGGKETALYKSLDGGDTWTKLTGRGMPTEPMARIGVSVSRSHPNTVYMVTETPTEGTLFRSDDAGATWGMVSEQRNINFRPFYYSDIRVDPNNAEVVWSLSGGLYKTTDGGTTFRSVGGGVHGDHQSLWIDPTDSDHVLSGSDGGYQVTWDGGDNWDIINNVVLSQFYQIYYDLQDPYQVCGGLQDNGVWCGPSQTMHGSILKDDWVRVSGGDGFYGVPVPDQPWLIYSNLQGGVFMITDMRSGGTRRVHPYPNRIGSAGDAMLGHKYRFNWDAPIHISPHDPSVVYIGGNHVFVSRDYGHSWDELSPDLTTQDTVKQLTSGGEIYQDNTAAEFYTTILTIAESPIEAGVIWVGTDDGNLWITRDGGANWTNITDNVDLPEYSWIAKIDVSHFDAGTAYIAVDQHRMDDFTPHVYRATDYGRRSTDLSGGLPQDDYVKVVREDPRNPNLLYVGMERGLFASWDQGDTWVDIRNGLPPVSVRDLQIHPVANDLIIGTHGRGAYIMDDIAPLQNLSTAMASDVYLFEARPAVRWQTGGRDASFGQRTYRAQNPPTGAIVNFYLAEASKPPVEFTVTDAAGNTVRTWSARDTQVGVNRTAWNLRADGPDPIPGQGGGGGGGFGGFGGGGPFVVPGNYTVTMSAAGQELSTMVTVRADPRIDITQGHYLAQWNAAIDLSGLTSQVHMMIGASNDLETQVTNLMNALDESDGDLKAACSSALDEIEAFKDWLTYPPPRMGYRQRPRLREELRSLMRSITGVASRPTEAEMVRLAELQVETAEAVAAFNQMLDTTIHELNNSAGQFPRIKIDRPIP